MEGNDAKSKEKENEEAMDEMVDAFGKMETPEELPEKSFEEELEEIFHHPAFMTEVDPSQPLDPLVEGLMQIKYEDEDPIARATAFKEDGNHEFQKKKYKVARDNYTEAIKIKCPDRLLNAVLYTNRAAAQFHIGNFRSAFNDCIFARKFKSDHMKAIDRGAQCLIETKKYEECIKWADEGLKIEPANKKFQDFRSKATKLLKGIERDKRKEMHQERKVKTEDMKLIQAIQGRSIKVARLKGGAEDEESDQNTSLLASLETHNPRAAKVHLDSNNILYWPVMFLYPEYTETDHIQMFCENQRLIDHLNHMFGAEAEPAPWDIDKKYKPHTINVYFEDRDKEDLIKVNKEKTLKKVLQHERYFVYGGTPAFILTVAGSQFEKSFLQRYGKS